MNVAVYDAGLMLIDCKSGGTTRTDNEAVLLGIGPSAADTLDVPDVYAVTNPCCVIVAPEDDEMYHVDMSVTSTYWLSE